MKYIIPDKKNPESLSFRMMNYFFFLDGTFIPFSRASEIPMAMACFLLVTFFPEEDFSFPSLNSCITSPTLS